MNNDFKALQESWKSSKKNIKTPANNFDALYKKIEQKEENFSFYYGTIILMITLIAVSLFLLFSTVEQMLSRWCRTDDYRFSL